MMASFKVKTVVMVIAQSHISIVITYVLIRTAGKFLKEAAFSVPKIYH